MDEEEIRLLKELDECRKQKCDKYVQEYEKEKKKFEKLQAQKCRQKDDKEYYDCTSEFFKGSKLEEIGKSKIECTQNKCKTQRKRLQNFRNAEMVAIFLKKRTLKRKSKSKSKSKSK